MKFQIYDYKLLAKQIMDTVADAYGLCLAYHYLLDSDIVLQYSLLGEEYQLTNKRKKYKNRCGL